MLNLRHTLRRFYYVRTKLQQQCYARPWHRTKAMVCEKCSHQHRGPWPPVRLSTSATCSAFEIGVVSSTLTIFADLGRPPWRHGRFLQAQTPSSLNAVSERSTSRPARQRVVVSINIIGVMFILLNHPSSAARTVSYPRRTGAAIIQPVTSRGTFLFICG